MSPRVPCPYLPAPGLDLPRPGPGSHGADFYRRCLIKAQVHWLDGKPAQAILQLDKAFLADLPRADAAEPWPPGLSVPPYRAMAWLLRHGQGGGQGFFGNPVRHFQHLASRMSGPRAAWRAWRAWACLHLAERLLPRALYPRDGWQMGREGLWIPAAGRVEAEIRASAWPGEWREWRAAWSMPPDPPAQVR